MTSRLVGVLGLGFVLASASPLACSSFNGAATETGDSPDGGTPSSGSDSGPPGVTGSPDIGIGLQVGTAGATNYVIQGAQASIPITLTRKASSLGAVTVTIVGALPAKVTAAPLVIPVNATDGALVLSADPDAVQAPFQIQIQANESAGATAISDLKGFVRGQPGALDTTFATTGILDLFGGDSVAQDVKPLSDGSLLVSGTRGNSAAVAKLKGDGTLDLTFGPTTDGITVLSGSQQSGFIALDQPAAPAPSYIYCLVNIGVNDLRLYRLNFGDGTIDNGFGGAGYVSVNDGLTANPFHFPTAISVTSDGKVLILAYNKTAMRLTRWNPDGSQDAAFATSGYWELPGIQSAAMIVRPGDAPLLFYSNTVVGLLASGAGDETVGPSPGFSASVPSSAVARAPDGNYVFGTHAGMFNSAAWSRTNSKFVVDLSIGAVGVVPMPNDLVGFPLVESDKSILFVGATTSTTLPAAYHAFANVTIDTNFGPDGLKSYPLPDDATATVSGGVQQPDGRIFIFGKNEHTFGSMLLRIWP